jgi:hypothetical protein
VKSDEGEQKREATESVDLAGFELMAVEGVGEVVTQRDGDQEVQG